MYIPDDLLMDSKKFALETGRTLTGLIEDSLRETLARSRHPRKPPAEPPTFGGGVIMPGVDLNNSAALWDLLDQDE